MPGQELSVIFQDISASPVEIAEVHFFASGRVQKIVLAPGRPHAAEPAKKEGEKEKRKVSAISSLNLPDKHWNGIKAE